MSVNQTSHCSRHLNKAILNQKSPQRFTFWHNAMAHCLVLCDNPSRRVSIRWNRERSNSTSLNSCQSQVWSLCHSDVYSRSFGNTGNLIPSLLQHPSVYLLINLLRAVFADQESGSQILFVNAHIFSFDNQLSDPGRLHYSNLYSFQKGPNNKKIFTASFWPRPCLALAFTCRLMTSLVTRVIACKTWQPSTA